MFNIPEKYEVNQKLPIKELISKELKADVKKKLKDTLVSVTLTHQIVGEEIASIIDENVHVEAIQYFDFEIKDIKKAAFIANTYQAIIKSPCIIRIHDTKDEIYSFALKRLNQNDNNEIVVVDNILTQSFPRFLPSRDKNKFLEKIDYNKIKNKITKKHFYDEMFVRAYLELNSKVYASTNYIIQKPIWYSEEKVKKIFYLFKKLKSLKEQIIKENKANEKMRINQEIKKILEEIGRIS